VTDFGRSAPVAVVGAGTMGGGIAQVAAVADHPVTDFWILSHGVMATGTGRKAGAGTTARSD
jgi:3-hydroxyacyl-CoA dehydrogenase